MGENSSYWKSVGLDSGQPSKAIKMAIALSSDPVQGPGCPVGSGKGWRLRAEWTKFLANACILGPIISSPEALDRQTQALQAPVAAAPWAGGTVRSKLRAQGLQMMV